MCGICGYLWLDGRKEVDSKLLETMCGRIRHRGPDDQGLYADGPVGLGMRRLSIIDLETGHQPIHNEDKTAWIVFNGEIYNFPELREWLEKKGHRFYTRSDTEAIVHLYEECGEDCVQHLNGMFAFAVWDLERQQLFLARDRLGKKPLHYTRVAGQFVFASEIKALLVHPDVERRLDYRALNKYLAYEYVPSPYTIFAGIHKLPPAHTLTVREGQIQLERYWRPLFPAAVLPRREEEASEELRYRLEEAVQRRLISDVPLGVFLSGGIDSSAVTALMARLVPGRVQSFSIGFADPSFDESAHARAVARYCGTDHHEQVLEPSAMTDLVPRLVEFLDEPLGDASILPTYLLAAYTRQHVTVALGGDGGDELFAGYPTYQAHRLAGWYERVPAALRRGIIEPLVRRLPVSTANFSLDFKAKHFIAGLAAPLPLRHHLWMGSFPLAAQARLLDPQVLAGLDGDRVYDEAERFWKETEGCPWLNRIQDQDLHLYLPEDILVKVDRASMACSLEVRAPFLDHTFVEFVCSLPPDLKLRGWTTKYLLKQALHPLLPRSIRHRPKKGFGIPVARWIQRELRPLALDLLTGEPLRRAGIFRPEIIQELLDEHFNGRRDNRKPLWTLMVFELWRRRWCP